MVPAFFDLNCNKSVCVKLPFLGQEIISKRGNKWQDKEKRIYNIGKSSGRVTEPGTNK